MNHARWRRLVDRRSNPVGFGPTPCPTHGRCPSPRSWRRCPPDPSLARCWLRSTAPGSPVTTWWCCCRLGPGRSPTTKPSSMRSVAEVAHATEADTTERSEVVVEYASDEIRAALRLTRRAADIALDLALGLARLPRVWEALSDRSASTSPGPGCSAKGPATSTRTTAREAVDVVLDSAPRSTTGQLPPGSVGSPSGWTPLTPPAATRRQSSSVTWCCTTDATAPPSWWPAVSPPTRRWRR